MREYHKIQTVFKRNPETKFKTLLEGEYSLPEFEYLKDNEWVFTEKVDGTNIRVMWDSKDHHITFGGRTEAVQIPATLLNVLNDMFEPGLMASVFDCDACLYGEGYGPKIQKVGRLYREDQSFVLFDVRIGEWWLERSAVEEIAEKLNINVVPIVGIGTLQEAIEMTREGVKSVWGDFMSEGMVMRPRVELKSRNGQRIITKIKHKDF